MGEYILRLFILLPLLGAMAWASLWFWKRLQEGTPLVGPKRPRAVDLVSVLPLGPAAKLAVVEFAGQQILVAVSRQGISRIASDAQGEFHVD